MLFYSKLKVNILHVINNAEHPVMLVIYVSWSIRNQWQNVMVSRA